MFFVLCPNCQSQIDIPADAVGPNRSELFNIVACDDCGTVFDYDEDECKERPRWIPRPAISTCSRP